MTIEEKLAHFLEASVQENTLASEEMLRSYQASLDKQFESHKARILQQAEAELDAELEEVRREGNKMQAHEHLVIKRALSQKHTELKEKLFEELTALVHEYRHSPEYPQLLLRQIRAAREFARDDQIVIYLDPQDTGLQSMLQRESGAVLTVSQYSFGGGIRAIIPQRHILIDNSFDSRIEEQKENFHFSGGNLHG